MNDIDLTDLLKDWPYEPGSVNVRLIRSREGRPIIQLRIDLGILQMEVEGRPDGARPDGFPSLLDFHLHELEAATAEGHAVGKETGSEPESNADSDESEMVSGTPMEMNEGEKEDEKGPAGEDFEISGGGRGDEDSDEEGDEKPVYSITTEECRAIREEAVQYYHRYIGLYALEEYDGVFDDATHNLQLIDLCRHYAKEDSDREAMEQLRLHTMMTRTRARAAGLSAAGRSKEAVEAIDHGLAEMGAFLESVGVSEDDFGGVGEIELLREMRDALIPKLPGSQKMELQERLKAALSAENYELAAILRDEIRMMHG